MSEDYHPSKLQKEVYKKILEKIPNKDNIINGYYTDYKLNFLPSVQNKIEIEKEIGAGNGNELVDTKKPAKFKAVHSSSALCVNNFAPFKQYMDRSNFFGYSNFIEATFEKKVPTGISFPNLDFYLENEKTIIGFESKYTEYLKSKLPNENLEKYINRKNSIELANDNFFSLFEEYNINTNHYHLDIAQLLKHATGLLSKESKIGKKAVLVYIFWLPENWKDFEAFKKHQSEIEEFKSKITKYIKFIPISYLEFWKNYEADSLFGNHIKEVMARYNLSL